jgi:Protein of unknown function (DUF2423)
MARSLRSKSLQANKGHLRTNIFKPVEDQRAQRLHDAILRNMEKIEAEIKAAEMAKAIDSDTEKSSKEKSDDHTSTKSEYSVVSLHCDSMRKMHIVPTCGRRPDLTVEIADHMVLSNQTPTRAVSIHGVASVGLERFGMDPEDVQVDTSTLAFKAWFVNGESDDEDGPSDELIGFLGLGGYYVSMSSFGLQTNTLSEFNVPVALLQERQE